MDSENVFRTLLEGLARIEDKNDRALADIQTSIGQMTGELGALTKSHNDHCASDTKRFDQLEKATAESTQQRRADDAVKAAQALVASEGKAALALKDAQRSNFRVGVSVAACAAIFGVLATLLVSHVSWH